MATTLLVLAITCALCFVAYGKSNDPWVVGTVALTTAIVCTIVPILYSFLHFGELNPPGDWFGEARYLGAHQKQVRAHYSRISGTLRFWKNKAAAYQRVHNARVLWSLVNAVGLPVLIQKYDAGNGWATLFLTELTTWTGLLVAFAYTFKAEEKYQGYRQQESDFYDLSREFLDEAALAVAKGRSIDSLVEGYIKKVREVRRVARRVETGSPPSAFS